MSFDSEWITLGRHRTLLRATRGFPTATLRTVAELAKLGIENTMSARARLVEVVYQDDDGSYEVHAASTAPKDKLSTPPLELALSTILGIPLDKISITVDTLSEREVELRFGVFERLLAQNAGIIPPLQ